MKSLSPTSRITSIDHLPVFIALTSIGLLLVLAMAPAQAAKNQSLQSIRMQTEAFILQYPYQSPYLPVLRTSKMDNRLRLRACQEPLKIEFSNRDRTYGNTSLRISCPKPTPWKLYMPVSIDIFDDVLVTSSTLSRGQKIDTNLVEYRKSNISRLSSGYYARDKSLKNLEAKRNLARGTILTPANLRPRLMVKSGQQVTLILNYKGLSIRSSGKALQSARIGQMVKVRNTQSRKIVEGVVAGESLVKVNL